MKGSARSDKPNYLCQQCGHKSPKWMGFCPQCRAGDALVETSPVTRSSRPHSDVSVVGATDIDATVKDRSATGVGELDRVLGGGLVPGVAVLVGGEPGIGKSTLLLQAADSIAASSGSVLIATAEESTHQVQMRARRVGVTSDDVVIASIHDVDDIISLVAERRPHAVIVDSIQTVSSMDIAGSAGGVAQVRDSAAKLIAFSKKSGTPMILVGHVTKDGSIAGPRTLEHMVDVVLYMEGESDVGFRFLRSIKNRYGSVNEVGVFDMTAQGLTEVPDPSGLLIAHRDRFSSGTVLFPTIEGKRPMVVEIQALVVKSDAPQPRRSITGLVPARVHQILGILERHAGYPMRSHEVYVSVMGGIRVTEPAADLPVALAIASAHRSVPLGQTAAWGEMGLTGDVRPASRPTVRTAEVERVASGAVIAPAHGHRNLIDALSVVEGLR